MLKNGWEKLPAWLRGALALVLTLAVLAGYSATQDAVARTSPDLAQAFGALCMILLLAGLGALVLAGRRRLGGREQASLFRRALRDGKLPAEADIGTWRPLLLKRAYDTSGQWMYGLVALLVFAANVGALSRIDHPGVGVVVLIVLLAVVVVALFPGVPWLMQLRYQRNARRLLDQMHDAHVDA